MKKSIIIILCTAFVLTGCNDWKWLDVSPESSVEGEKLFSNETGFKQALTGAYTLMANSDLYGRNTSFLLPEALAHHWTVTTISSSSSSNRKLIYYLNKFDFEEKDTKSRISTVWKAYFKVIAQCNDIMAELAKKNVVFYNDNDKLIEGEALGLRAYLHFEVLRLWGPVPSAGSSATGIPYVTQITNDISSLTTLSYGVVVQNILNDLNEAEAILKEYDPVMKYSNDVLNNRANLGSKGPAEEWQFLRQSRFNYYAVLGAKARLYQWIGEPELAMEYAQKVIDATNEDGTKKFLLMNDSQMSAHPEYSFRSEQLFGLNNPKLSTNSQEYFKDGMPPLLSRESGEMRVLYDVSETTDIRFTTKDLFILMDFNEQSRAICNKYTGTNTQTDAYNFNLIPVLRLAEMYLIMIENLPLEDIRPYLTEFVTARGLTQTLIDEVMSSEANRDARVFKEYQKEFFAEGQMFFFYKRNETTSMTWPVVRTMDPENYVIPKPDNQMKFE